ncbi:MAG: alpha-glucan family phosphorylase [Phycisphaeraceae bacterium]|nr:alpha-glucan family phosphorylase [Phycisphaerae bacterium]MBX3392866.1 alpha-glucan family phosphorylase [Phycisphaeraceae bacterium]HRJ49195.1 alpha-glucan family phosphorylase [Phycisphaerales bacterium]
MRDKNRLIAYFSMEIGLETHIPTYSGGLGILAGDTLRAAADMGLPYAGVTLLYRDGYFTQKIVDGSQVERPTAWNPEQVLDEMPQRGYVPIEGRPVLVRAFRLMLRGVTGHYVPVYYLDTDLPENTPEDRLITRALYTGNSDWRIKQEAILGIGGRRMLRAFTHDVACFHMNEGHAVFLTVELLSEHLARFDKSAIDEDAIRQARRQCVFTTHTPIEAGHDRFPIDRVRAIIGDHPAFHRPDLHGEGGVLNTTILALNLSRFSNGVARKHGEVSRAMFPHHRIDSITNGVHAASWVSRPMAALFDQFVPSWRVVNSDLRLARGIPDERIWEAHQESKHALIDVVESTTGETFDAEVLTICFARRMTAYKRAAMLLSDPDRLRSIARTAGRLQIVYAGKAHPHDGTGKGIIASVNEAITAIARDAGADLRLVFIPNYDIGIARTLVAGADLWLNTPEPPLEASGTSGMKAALNGVPSLSTMDGWWIEGCVEGETGWGIGQVPQVDDSLVGHKLGREASAGLFRSDAAAMYDTLEHTIVPTYYKRRSQWIDLMKSSISINGSHFTTERMLRDYLMKAYDE